MNFVHHAYLYIHACKILPDHYQVTTSRSPANKLIGSSFGLKNDYQQSGQATVVWYHLQHISI